jgi:hypothetical protein
MGEFLDRNHQRTLLEELRDSYPEVLAFGPGNDENSRRQAVNLHYLLEHGLIAGRVLPSLSAGNAFAVRISAKGLDFLQDDGGLSAILGVVTVKLHDDTIRKLIQKRIDDDPNLAPQDKNKAREVLGTLSSKAMATVVEELTKKGLEHFPNLIPYLMHAGQAAIHGVGLA